MKVTVGGTFVNGAPILNGATVETDGDHRVGRLTEQAATAHRELLARCRETLSDDYDDLATAATTDQQIAEMARTGCRRTLVTVDAVDVQIAHASSPAALYRARFGDLPPP